MTTDKQKYTMKFKLLTASLYASSYDDTEIDDICTKLKGTVYEKRISITSQFNEFFKRIERKVFININSLEELKELSKIFNKSLILNFEEEQPYIVIYDDYIE